MRKILNQETLIPISLAIVIGYMIFFVGTYASKLEATMGEVTDLKARTALIDDRNKREHQQIILQLGRIEGFILKIESSQASGKKF
jgi:hypothetical protein